jgi:hypothetical protein
LNVEKRTHGRHIDSVRLMLSRQAIDFPFTQLFAELDEANE